MVASDQSVIDECTGDRVAGFSKKDKSIILKKDIKHV